VLLEHVPRDARRALDLRTGEHDLDRPLPLLGRFAAVVSSFAVHHLEHERKRSLHGEVFDLPELYLAFFAAIDEPIENEDPSDRALDVETQLGWVVGTDGTVPEKRQGRPAAALAWCLETNAGTANGWDKTRLPDARRCPGVDSAGRPNQCGA